ncbi:MAG: AraC family transcriptional regulator [Treponema sp.]|nr:AraC family transcriptional regulator [Treponema sp.]
MRVKLEKVKNYNERSNLLVRVILSYLLIGVVLISALSFFLYSNFSRYSINEIENIAGNMTLQYYNISDKLLNSIYNYFYNLYYSDYTHTADFTVFTALYSKEFNESENAVIRRKLTSEVMANPWIYSIYIYNRGAGVIFSNLSPALPIEDFYDRDIVSIINTGRRNLNPIYIPRKMDYSIDEKPTQLSTLSIINAEYSAPGDPQSAMVVNINLQEIQNIFITNDNRAQMFILDNNGIVVTHVDTSKVNTDMSGESWIKNILSGTDTKGSFLTKINNQNSLVTFIKSDRALGWTIVRIDNMDELLRNMAGVRLNVLLITILFVLAGIFIAVYFTVGLYVPLDRRLKNLSVSVKKYEPIRKNYLLKHLLEGKTNNSEIDELGLHNIDTNAHGFVVMVLSFDSFNKLSRQHPSGTISLYKHSLINSALNILKEAMGSEYIVGTYEDNDDHVCLILSLGSSINVDKINIAAAGILNYVNANFDYKITISISESVNYLINAANAYNNALTYLNYKIVLGCRRVITCDDISGMVFAQYEYPLKKEKQLAEALKLCEKTLVEKLLDEILLVIKVFSYDEIMLSLIQLALGSIRAMEDMINIKDMPADLEYSNLFKNMGKFDSMTEIRQWFMTMYSWVIDILNAKRDTRRDAIVEKLDEYINVNYANPNLSIDMLADTVGLSANYVRIIYKEKTSRSISVRISDIRLGKAKELLLTTNISINKIPEMVGFQSSGYFYKNFRKNTGKTPDQYRKDKQT